MDNYEIMKLEPQYYNKYSNVFNSGNSVNDKKKTYHELISGNRVIFIYTKNKEYIAEISLIFDKNDPDYTIRFKRIYLSRLCVRREYRNMGIGGTLIDFVIKFSKSMGYQEISLSVNLDNVKAVHLYDKKGFNYKIYEGEDEYGKYMKLLKILDVN